MSSSVTAADGIASIADRIGFLALCALAFFQIENKTVSLAALFIMLLCLLTDVRRLGRTVAQSDVARLTLVIAVYVGLRAVIAAWNQPQLTYANFHRLTDWVLLVLFPLVAWFSRGQTGRVLLVLGLSLPGILLGLWQLADWHHVAQAWVHAATRVIWGSSPNTSALYLGTALLGWVVLAQRIVGRGRGQWLRALGWFFVVAILSEMLFLNQSRSVLLSLALLVPGVTLLGVWRLANSGFRKQAIVYALIVILGSAGLSVGNWGRVAHRYHETAHTVHTIDTLHKAPDTSLGYRIQLYILGGKAWLQRPVVGWGPGYEASEMYPGAPVTHEKKRFDHLHDGYLEILVRFGILGFALIGLLALAFCRDFFRAWRRGDVPHDIGLFLLSAAVLSALVNLITFQLVHKPYAFLHILLLGLMYGYVLRNPSQRVKARRAPAAPTRRQADA